MFAIQGMEARLGYAVHFDWAHSAAEGTITKLTHGIVSPALDGSVLDERAGVALSGAQHRDSGKPRDRKGFRPIEVNGAVSGLTDAVSDLIVVVVSPACHRAIGEQGARVVAADHHRDRIGQSQDANRQRAVHCCSIPKLSGTVLPPSTTQFLYS